MDNLQHSYNKSYCNQDELTQDVLFEIGVYDRDGNERGRNVKNKKPHIIMPSDCWPTDKDYWQRAKAFLRVNIQTGEVDYIRPYSEVVSRGYYEAVDENGKPLYEHTEHIPSVMPVPKVDIPKDPNQGIFRKGRPAAEILAEECVPTKTKGKLYHGKTIAEIFGIEEVV